MPTSPSVSSSSDLGALTTTRSVFSSGAGFSPPLTNMGCFFSSNTAPSTFGFVSSAPQEASSDSAAAPPTTSSVDVASLDPLPLFCFANITSDAAASAAEVLPLPLLLPLLMLLPPLLVLVLLLVLLVPLPVELLEPPPEPPVLLLLLILLSSSLVEEDDDAAEGRDEEEEGVAGTQ